MESEPEIVYELVPEVVPEIVPETVVEPEVEPVVEPVVVPEPVVEPVVVPEPVVEPVVVPEPLVEPVVVPEPLVEPVVVPEPVVEPVVVPETVDETNLLTNVAIAVKSDPIVLATIVNILPDSLPILTANSPTLQFTAVVLPLNTTNKTVTWSSSDTTVATINSTTGLATRVALGSAIIRATTTDGSNKVISVKLRVKK